MHAQNVATYAVSGQIAVNLMYATPHEARSCIAWDESLSADLRVLLKKYYTADKSS